MNYETALKVIEKEKLSQIAFRISELYETIAELYDKRVLTNEQEIAIQIAVDKVCNYISMNALKTMHGEVMNIEKLDALLETARDKWKLSIKEN